MARKKWAELLNRKNKKTGEPWVPTTESRICSKHFVDGEPTEKNPYPTLYLDLQEVSDQKKSNFKIPLSDRVSETVSEEVIRGDKDSFISEKKKKQRSPLKTGELLLQDVE